MSYLINDSLIWISNPKCASLSIETTLISSNLKLKKFQELFNRDRHIHVTLDQCLDYFGKKESVCITRNWFEKWLSSFNYIFDTIENKTPLELECKWEDIDNTFIYKLIDDDFLNTLHTIDSNNYVKCFSKFLKHKKVEITGFTNSDKIPNIIQTLISEKYWKSNKKCTYEFDIKKINEFTSFIEKRFDEKLIFEQVNVSTKRPNKIIVNDELKSFIWEKFEKRYEKRNQLI